VTWHPRLKWIRLSPDTTQMELARTPQVNRDERFRALVEEIPAVTYIADFVGTFALRYVSPQCKAILGYEPDDWIGDPDAWVQALHPDDRDRIVAEAEACIERQLPFDFEYRMHTADGRVLHFWEKTSIVRDEQGEPVSVNGVMLDVTELKEAQDALLREAEERANERAEYEILLRRQLAENEYRALHDDLTGLANRRQLNVRLADALERDGGSVALLVIDLDRFKEVNDVLGHHCGDDLLREVGQRFALATREGDLLARLGGDEFAVLLTSVVGAVDAVAVAERLGTTIGHPFALGGVPVYAEASIGIALAPEHGTSADALLQHADVAMYEAKRLGGGWRMFDVATGRAPAASVSRLAELRLALTNDELVLHYQPKIEVATRRITGVEALVRWAHPTRGLLLPAEFVPLAEHTGLIRPLTTFVLETALGQARRWRDDGHYLTVAVNVAARSLSDIDFSLEIERVLDRHGLAGDVLEVELTETGLMHDPTRALESLKRLHEMGVRIAIDDFGAGYSSLTRLRDLPIDDLKIDRTFVASIGDDNHGAEIVKSAIALGQSLGMSVVAEGVESEGVLRCLEDFGCNAAQGYHISEPVESEAIARMLPTTRNADVTSSPFLGD
jgi:diguanylate cyclase (GGDEF)-like protein/PAS domain S-box-containing protein